MACNKDLMAAGSAYPRTCAECGLMGPCKKYPVPVSDADEAVRRVARAILAMNYGALTQLANEINITSESLFSWAQSKIVP